MDWNSSTDPLVVPQLPAGNESPDWCELSERVGELPRRSALYETVRYLVILALVASTTGFLPRYAEGTPFSGVPELWFIILGVKLVVCFVYYLTGSSRLLTWLGRTGVWILLGALLWMQAEAENHIQGYLCLFLMAVGFSSWLAFLITHQFVFFAAANLNNEWHVADSWRSSWLDFTSGNLLGQRSSQPLKFNSLPGMFAALCIAFAVGALVNHRFWLGELGFLLTLIAMAPVFWPKESDVLESLNSSLRALEVFMTYERKTIAAPGVFRFPTRWLRPHKRRILAVLVPLIMVSLSMGTTLPAKWPQLPRYDVIERPASPPSYRSSPAMTRHEEAHLERIKSLTEQGNYVDLLKRRRAYEQAVFVHEQKIYAQKVVTTAVACVLIPPAIVFGTLVFLFGPVLAAYRRNLDGNAES